MYSQNQVSISISSVSSISVIIIIIGNPRIKRKGDALATSTQKRTTQRSQDDITGTIIVSVVEVLITLTYTNTNTAYRVEGERFVLVKLILEMDQY